MRHARGAFVMVLITALAACGGKAAESAPPAPTEPMKAVDPAPADKGEPATPPKEGTDPGAAKADPTPTEVAPGGAAPGDPPATAAGADADAVGGEAAAAAGDVVQSFVYPAKNTVIRDPQPESIEGVIARALAAAMNPDDDKGWAEFSGLLHSSEKSEMSLVSRRRYNWPAMKRKVNIFLIEDKTKPIYKWAYAEEYEEGAVIKVFVFNPKSSPTPCYVKRDPEQENKWRITSCSL